MTDREHTINYIPKDDPTLTTLAGFNIHVYETDGIVPDVIIWRRDGDEHVRIWGFQSNGPLLVLAFHADHKHPPDYSEAECRQWSVYDDMMPALETGPETPAAVTDLATHYSDAPVADKSHGGPTG